MDLKTRRLIINEFNQADIFSWSEIDCNPEVRKYLPQKIISAVDAQKYIEETIQSYQRNGFGRYAVRYKKTNKLIGMCGFLLEDYGIDFGYRFAPSVWAQGIGYEAAERVLSFGKLDLGLSPIYALALKENCASIKIIEKLNFRFTGLINIYQKDVLKYIS